MENSQPLEFRTAARPFDQFITPGGRISLRAALLTLGLCARRLGRKDK